MIVGVRRKHAVAVAAWFAIAAASWHVITFVSSAGARALLPYDIDWLEGDMIEEAARLARGLAIYRQATDGYLPAPYPPLYFATLAALGRVVPLDYALARVVSACAIGVVAAVMAIELRAHVGGKRGRVMWAVGAGAVACGYADAHGYFDLARADPLATAWAALAVFASLRARGHVWASVCLCAAIYTKQNMVLLAPAIALAMGLRDRRRAAWFLGLVALECAVVLGVLQHATGGAFLAWQLAMRHHDVLWARAPEAAVLAVSGRGWLVLAPVVLAVPAARRALTPRAMTWLIALVAVAAAGALPLMKVGGNINNFVAVSALAMPVGLLVTLDLVRPRSALAWAGVLFGAGAVLMAKTYDGERFHPTRAAIESARDASAVVRALPGDVVCPLHPFFVTRSGHDEEQLPWLNHLDASSAEMTEPARYIGYLLARRPDYIILDGNPSEDALRDAMASAYVLDRELPVPTGDALPAMELSPRFVYRRR